MKRILPLILIISLFGMAFLGSALMVMDQNHSGSCIASEAIGTDCPTSIAAFTFHHVDALRSIMTSLIAPLSNSLIALSLLLVVFALVFIFSKDLYQPNFNFPQRRVQDLEISSSYGKQKIFSWLSLFELSPAI